ncbi:MAG: hypothetical protein A4E37_01646 [Methanoregulaceae archaeon PtaB.Bin056]|nr:MAG: hypothetical protein A4E37_01646 [Methanoregulaceae archaeon PtaB.Bin056]
MSGQEGETLSSLFGEVIHTYTRADALRDGTLIEIPGDICREAGIIVPVAVTAGVWDLIAPEDLDKMPGQSVAGRTWDLLWMLACAARTPRARGRSSITFQCIFLTQREAMGGAEVTEHKTISLRSLCGPGDQGEPVITIMLPWED